MIFLYALLGNIILASLAYWKQSVSVSGFIAGIVAGTGIWVMAGFRAWIILGLFFVTSSAFSRYRKSLHEELHKMHKRGNRRDAIQVIANAGIAFFLALLYWQYGEPELLLLLAVSFAASTSDTWASEIGATSDRQPLSITRLKPVTPGLSGGVTTRGFAASLAGSLFIALAAVLLFNETTLYSTASMSIVIVTLSGLSGSVVDSILGDTIQAKYHDGNGQVTEKPGDGHILTSGVSWMNNDMVNIISNFAALLTALLLLSAQGSLNL